jgi:hypothetical protein
MIVFLCFDFNVSLFFCDRSFLVVPIAFLLYDCIVLSLGYRLVRVLYLISWLWLSMHFSGYLLQQNFLSWTGPSPTFQYGHSFL